MVVRSHYFGTLLFHLRFSTEKRPKLLCFTMQLVPSCKHFKGLVPATWSYRVNSRQGTSPCNKSLRPVPSCAPTFKFPKYFEQGKSTHFSFSLFVIRRSDDSGFYSFLPSVQKYISKQYEKGGGRKDDDNNNNEIDNDTTSPRSNSKS